MPSFSLATLGGAPPLSLPSVRPLAVGLGGTALFGFALRTAVSHEGLSVTHFSWALALPAVTLLSWALCLPALYILWATRHPQVGAHHCLHAAREAVHTLGQCLASTTPILWFFAATAPGSRIGSVLAFLFTGLALLGCVHVFVQSLQRQGAALTGFPRLAFLCLHTLTFAQCAHGAGLSLS
jgi:hypothetical protein